MSHETEQKASAVIPTSKRLVYFVHGLTKGLVFADLNHALFLSQMWLAITESRTWGDFRRRFPPAEYARLQAEWQENWVEADGEPVVEPRDSDPFDSEWIVDPDGYYPPLLRDEMHLVI